ncbi:MAG: ribonuclease R [Bacteroidales bacterium]|jgi:ribonuclease R|nr:ribonuclease R [Bacteroidales bacterium]
MSKKKSKKDDYRDVIKNQVLEAFISNSNRTMNYKQVSKLLAISDKKTREIVNRAIDNLVDNGSLLVLNRGKYKINPVLLKAASSAQTLEGIVDMKQTGKAYVILDSEMEDVFIAASNTERALDGDRVKIVLFPRRKSRKTEGRIVEVVQRARTQFVGRVQKGTRISYFIADNVQMPMDIMVPNDLLKNARNGEKVIVKLTDWPEYAKNPIGEVVEVLGMPGNNEVEMKSILAGIDYPLSFPDEVLESIKNIPEKIPQEEIKKRKDFRDILTITIDPQDAKDFDDAISFKELGNKTYEVGIHIADVSHYVTEGSLIDEEAYARATSVYLVDRTVPMLPEKISNGLCSLRPNEDKLCFSAVFKLNENAKILDEWFGRTVVRSDRRYDYDEVQEIIEGGEGDNKEMILMLDSLAKKLREERMKRGSINFESVEVKFLLDENAKPVDVYVVENKDSNRLIEDFMLLANRRVANLFSAQNNGGKEKISVYRIHDEPNQEKLAQFSAFVTKLGYGIKTGSRNILVKSFNKLFEDTKGKGEQNMIETIAIRTMSKAQYSTDNIGHYGLGFSHYTHFTAPIRRYPDLMTHRLLQLYLDKAEWKNKEDLENKCKHSSIMEIKAAEAERSSVKYKQAEYLADKIGHQFDGIISGVSKWGLFVEIQENKCEGMVSVKRMLDDFYQLDEDNYQMVGMRHGKVYRLGDRVKIKVRNVDLFRKQMDFDLVIEKW